MKLLLLGCHLLLLSARGDSQLNGRATTPETDTAAGGEGVETVEGQEGTTVPQPSDQPTSQDTTPTAADEATTSSPQTTTPDLSTPPDVGEELTVGPEAESGNVVHESTRATHTDTSTTPTTTTTTTTTATSTTTTVAPVSEESTLSTLSPISAPPDDSPVTVAETSHSGEDTSTSTPSTSGSTGVDPHHSVTTTTSELPPPAVSTTTSTDPTTTMLTTTTTTDTPSSQATTTTTTTTTEMTDGASTSTTLTADTTTSTTTATVTTIAGDFASSSTQVQFPEVNVTPSSTAQPEPSAGVCFGKTEVNTLVVVAVVVAVNVASVVLTALCVHRIVSRRLSWDLLPLYRQRSTRGVDEVRKRNPSGRNLASDTECKAGEGGGQAGTHIPILITNEDGWCVPYSNEAQDGKKRQKKEAATTVDTGV